MARKKAQRVSIAVSANIEAFVRSCEEMPPEVAYSAKLLWKAMADGDATSAVEHAIALGRITMAFELKPLVLKEIKQVMGKSSYEQDGPKRLADIRRELERRLLKTVPDEVQRNGRKAIYAYIANQVKAKPDTVRKHLRGENFGIG